MEENKTQNKGQKKLSYDELNKAASDLSVQYQKLMAEYKKAIEALKQKDFDEASFFLSLLFKVMEHPEMYKEEFINWAAEGIQTALVNLAERFSPKEEEKGETE